MPTPYKYRGAAAMVQLHAEHMREFVKTWRAAKAAGVKLPETDDPDYESLEVLLRHLLRAARGYMVWMCEKLELSDPEINPAPEVDDIASAAESYLEHVLERWDGPLRDVPEEKFGKPEFESRWKVRYCIDAMLEHAVMHPIRHTYQLKMLMPQR